MDIISGFRTYHLVLDNKLWNPTVGRIISTTLVSPWLAVVL